RARVGGGAEGGGEIWGGRGGLLARQRAGRAGGDDDIDVDLPEFARQPGKLIVSAVGPAIFDYEVLSLLVSELAKSPSQCIHQRLVLRVREHAEKSHPVGLCGRLCPHRERPRRRAAYHSDELAPPHFIEMHSLSVTAFHIGSILPAELRAAARRAATFRLGLRRLRVMSATDGPNRLGGLCPLRSDCDRVAVSQQSAASCHKRL